MQLLKDIEAVDLGLYLVKYKTLIVSDFHLGFEASLKKQGVLLPQFQFQDIIKRLAKIFRKINPETIIINGDLKHEFGKISKQEWKDTLKLIDYLNKHCSSLILIKGNHDTILGPIALKRNIKIIKEYVIGDILITHGDRLPDLKKPINKAVNTIIIGHEHPAITLKDEAKSEKFKCFLQGKYKRRNLIVTPSFNLLTQGTDILEESLLSPILKDSKMSIFRVFVVNDEDNSILYFGKLRDL